MQKPKDRSRRNTFITIISAFVILLFAVIVVLAIMGPTVGNIFSNVVNGLGGGGGSYGGANVSYRAPMPAAPVSQSLALQYSVDDVASDEEIAGMTFEEYTENPIVDAAEDNLSTFAMDVDTASYTLARGYLLNNNQMPPANAIRPEEFINYFPANYVPPTDDAFAIHMDAARTPFGDDGQVLLRVGVQGRYIAPEDRDSALLIFVIDTSGSMSGETRLGLTKEALNLLMPQLRPDDRVGIVQYAEGARVVLEPTSASNRDAILNAINRLEAGGSTYAEEGLRLGYELALNNMQGAGITRIILLSDGVANVGETGPDAILETIRNGVEEGITMTSIGIGMGNYNDTLLEQLANDGNGSYFYVDGLREARRVFIYSLTSTLQVIAYDAKIQVEFNPDVVTSYRLIGYENRAIADEDFRNDTVDAGEVGAGYSVTALYELTLADGADTGEVARAYIRYEDADTREVIEVNNALAYDAIPGFSPTAVAAPYDFRLLASVAEFAELLRESQYAADGSYAAVLETLAPLQQRDPVVDELISMVEAANRLQQ